MIHIFKDKQNKHTFLTLHGTGGDEFDLVPLAEYLNPKFNILSPRGNVNEQGMNRFFKRYGMGLFDIPNLLLETDNLYQFIKDSEQKYAFSINDVIALGFSNGANILESLIQLKSETPKIIILLSPVFVQPNVQFKDLSDHHIYVSIDPKDPYLKPGDMEQLIEALEHANAQLTVYKHHYGHQVNMQVLEHLKSWLESLI
ncbi:Predicted esterase [Acholeplasma oculi]|uniref:Phospholipase/carboxylesterase/thioesterase n=1 Tax=Acholeplasma oculi TaxID=35623 RepID=A0A061AIJ0_9MOLU|nr:hypothetical protein [Acholeplasma oculi]CDR30777.1 Phospholipase/carboxylesterase/thioesterase [Acholeplasma oculi]SKC34940.1 phospholipase/carboxylesterase [Acholeplasma oculi]SUT89717.1 Predicted esterase [Acholeplasma oculi]